MYCSKICWKRNRIEFEFKSKNFQNYKHNPNGWDVIVCWEHEWEDCPIEVIELKDIIKGLENRSIENPEITVIDLWSVSQDRKTFLSEIFNFIRFRVVISGNYSKLFYENKLFEPKVKS